MGNESGQFNRRCTQMNAEKTNTKFFRFLVYPRRPDFALPPLSVFICVHLRLNIFSSFIHPNHTPGNPGTDQVGRDITPLSTSAGCQGRLQDFNQNAKGGSVQKRTRRRPPPRPKGEVRESGCSSNGSGMVQFIPPESGGGRTGRQQRQPDEQK